MPRKQGSEPHGLWRSRVIAPPQGMALVGWKAAPLALVLLLSSCSTSAFKFATAPSAQQIARQALEQASVPANVVAPDVEGRLALARRDYSEAATFYEMSITRSPKLKDAYLGAASAFTMMGHFDRADVYFGLYNRHFGEDLAFLNDYGFSLALRGDTDKAQTYLQAAQRQAANSESVANNLQLLMMLQEGNKIAREHRPAPKPTNRYFWGG